MTEPRSELVVVRGADALAYLQGQLSQDLAAVQPPESVWTLVLDPRGTLVAVGVAHVRAADVVALEVPLGVAPPCAARLERFALRAAVEIRGPVELDVAADALLATELARIDAGIPGPAELARDLAPLALTADLADRCISYTKGCYTGQELVARMHARNAIPPYVLRRATLDAPAAVGDPVGDAAFDGLVTSVAECDGARWRALCVLHRRDAATGQVVVHASGGAVTAQLD